ncbi:MAG: tRNA guanosine(34) transglycosylase Tgt [Chloroflexi bacterium HGW-Chloroflexi-1]|nr:MAG: tRNA guanosine(34) transglycosylase Tgt [Chloroflexi bacterium HGW-Chloroflexi-1]
MFDFSITATDPNTAARTGVFETPHGSLVTPVFAPVGTQATVKTLTPRDLHEVGATLVLANTYHLYLRPGPELIADFGGLHSFMGWPGPLLTDSGGYQVFSLAQMRKLDDDGVTFRSHIDGSLHRFTPESTIAAQEALGADIIMCLDECAEPTDRAYNEAALARTHAWAARCQATHHRSDQALLGIVQGGIFPDLRAESAHTLRALDFAGYAIGGLSVGETKAEMYATLDVTIPALPATRPRYLMGVGTPEDIVESVARGIDIFDCVLPTRVARNGGLLTRRGRMNLRNAQYAADPLPIEPGCDCYTCQHFSRAYLRHLFKAGETLGLHLATVHNVRFILRLMTEIRGHIATGTYRAFRDQFLGEYRLPNQDVRHAQHAARRRGETSVRKPDRAVPEKYTERK